MKREAKKLRKLLFMIIFLGCLAFTNSSLAEEKKDEWVDHSYNFKQLKTILVQYSFSDSVKLDESEQQKLINKISEMIFNDNQKSKLRFIPLSQAEDTIGKMAQTNITELKASDYGQYNDVMDKNLPNIVDAIVKLKINSQGFTTRHIPESTEQVIEHHYSYVTRWNQQPHGLPYATTETIDNPTTTIQIIPAHDIQVGHAGVEVELLSNNNAQVVWHLTDIREADNKQPIDMTGRICKRAIDRLTTLAKGKR